jgi:hypothetical protein
MKEDRISLLKYMLVEAIGFGIGGLFCYISYLNYTNIHIPYVIYRTISGSTFGAIGGLSLGISSKNVKKILRLILSGTIGFAIVGMISEVFLCMGQLIALFIIWFFEGPAFPDFLLDSLAPILRIFIITPIFIVFFFEGAIGRGFYGFALKNNKKAPSGVNQLLAMARVVPIR